VTTFVDTSAFYAMLSEDDARHEAAIRWLDEATTAGERLVTANYVVLESTALIHARMGNAAVRAFLEEVLPPIEVGFVDESLHRRATSAFLAGLGRRPSFVDRVSFEMMRETGIRRAFAFDPDFAREGFETVP
jgi:predicted nucleic acid-binding protein